MNFFYLNKNLNCYSSTIIDFAHVHVITAKGNFSWFLEDSLWSYAIFDTFFKKSQFWNARCVIFGDQTAWFYNEFKAQAKAKQYNKFNNKPMKIAKIH